VKGHHPVWKTFHFVACSTVVVGGLLFINASHFDKTELITLLEFAGVAVGWKMWSDRK